MSNHFHNVTQLIDAAHRHDTEPIINLLNTVIDVHNRYIDDEELDEHIEDLARSILFMMVTLQSHMTPRDKVRFKETVKSRLLQEESCHLDELEWNGTET